jgi:putative FmdB family regulatory protein
MPLYEYLCKKCDQRVELLIQSSAVPTCPDCGSTRLQKLISAPIMPGRSAGIIAAGRARAVREGHTSNYRKKNGKIVD